VSNDAILPDLLADDTFEAIEVLARHNKSDRPPESNVTPFPTSTNG